MFRKQRRISPSFKVPPPFNPIAGGHADLRTPDGVMPYCAMMQIAADDEYYDYVVCRGFDPRILKFIDYEEGNSNKPGISVAKPFGSRRPNTYSIGEIYPAFLPIQGSLQYTPPSPVAVEWRLGQNPGVVDSVVKNGHPESLSDEIMSLVDHNDKAVNWLLIKSGEPAVSFVQAPSGGIPARVTATPGEIEGCYLVFVATEDGTGYLTGDFVRTDDTVLIKNWGKGIHGAVGDRVIQVEGHFNGAFIIGDDCDASGSATDIKVRD